MSSLAIVREAAADVDAAMEAGDWDRADRALQYLVGAWQRARLSGREAVEAKAILDDMRIRVVTGYDVPQVVGPVQVAWMLAGICSVATQAAPHRANA